MNERALIHKIRERTPLCCKKKKEVGLRQALSMETKRFS